tara:strand:+ start:728 stop:901 length:174 start_codon:yes stop_codon:yes gene_type:complete
MERTGIFIHNENPSPLMQKVMENIQRQMQAETERRQRIREGLEPDGQWTNWNISDRH